MNIRRQTAILLRRELRSELRAGEVSLVAIPFGAIAMLLVPMAVGTDTPLLVRIGPGIFWSVVLLFGVVVTQRQTADVGGPQLDLLRLLGVDPAARFAATALAGAALLLAFELVVGLVTVVLYDPALDDPIWLAAILPAAAFGLAVVGTLAGNIAAGVGTRVTLAPLLVAPLAIPILLGAAQATEGLRLGESILAWLLLLVITDLVLAAAGVLTARPLEEAAP